MIDGTNKSYPKDNRIEIIRVVATILVVIGHAGFYKVSTSIPNMGIDWTNIIQDNSYISRMISIGTELIYSCHMQLFFLISGMVYMICVEQGKYIKLSNLILNKFERLIIPYVLVSILYCIPILLIVNYFNDENSGNTILNICLYFWGLGKNHLWFLVSLFFIFIMTFLLQKNKKILFLSAISLFLFQEFYCPVFMQIFYLDRIAKYWIWFLIGMFLYQYKMYIDNFLKKKIVIKLLLFLNLWIFAFFASRKVSGISFLVTASGLCFFYIAVCAINIFFATFCETSLFKMVKKNSMNIYLYGVPLNYLFMSLVLLGKESILIGNLKSVILFVVRIIIQIFGSILIAYIVEKAKRYLLKVSD